MITERVIAVIAGIKRIPAEQITIDTTFEELGLDSLDGVEIIGELEEQFGIIVPDDVARSMTGVRQVVDGLEPLVADAGAGASPGEG
jgi:acyl carrier protein